jgi:hypothetical protein
MYLIIITIIAHLQHFQRNYVQILINIEVLLKKYLKN